MALCLSVNMQFQAHVNALRSILSELRDRNAVTGQEYEFADSCLLR